MSKSAFYASKEALRHTREEELKELIELRKFKEFILNLSKDEMNDIVTLIDIRIYAEQLSGDSLSG